MTGVWRVRCACAVHSAAAVAGCSSDGCTCRPSQRRTAGFQPGQKSASVCHPPACGRLLHPRLAFTLQVRAKCWSMLRNVFFQLPRLVDGMIQSSLITWQPRVAAGTSQRSGSTLSRTSHLGITSSAGQCPSPPACQPSQPILPVAPQLARLAVRNQDWNPTPPRGHHES